MKVPTDRKYAETHEWFLVDGDVVTIGITQYAADELTDITFVELPAVGARLASGAGVGEVESVKATSEMYTVVGGEVLEINGALGDHPELVNDSAFEEGWMVKIRAESVEPLTALMDASEYESFLQGQD